MTRRFQINMLILMQASSSLIESLKTEELCRWDHVAVTKYQPLLSNFLVTSRSQRSQPYRDRLVFIVRTDYVNSTTDSCTADHRKM